MELSALTAVSPIDGRYGDKRPMPAPYLLRIRSAAFSRRSRGALVCKTGQATPDPGSPCLERGSQCRTDGIVSNFNEQDAARIKQIERTTNHDVKAVE